MSYLKSYANILDVLGNIKGHLAAAFKQPNYALDRYLS